MKHYALSIANEFVDIAKHEDNNQLTMLKLMKLTYIAHGFILALLDKPVDGSKKDKVEAWRLGPVFPSVYYSFKQYGSDPIKDYATDLELDSSENETFKKITPRLQDDNEKKICKYVWKNYSPYSANELVNILHNPGTPWFKVYEENKNNVIPDEDTKKYYNVVVSIIKQKNG